uniref:Limiting CO2-inducible protein B/C beta carbonyic anhydrase domain-containing protein n=1 Tax=Alexandrium monilatum TaxID=311494 RepID=A0A7S4TBW6_9DINO
MTQLWRQRWRSGARHAPAWTVEAEEQRHCNRATPNVVGRPRPPRRLSPSQRRRRCGWRGCLWQPWVGTAPSCRPRLRGCAAGSARQALDGSRHEGFFAMSHNVPEDGHILVVFGPHIGITPDGELGKVLRRGRSAKSTCGALTTAYDQLTSGGRPRGDRREPYWAWIRDALRPHLAAVRDSSQPMMALVRKFYQIVEDQVLAITTTSYCPGNLVLLGGITINMPHPAPGYFLPLHFSVRSKIMQPKDLMPALQL